jgi:hypothetical protein
MVEGLMDAEALIAEGERRATDRNVRRLRWEAKDRSPLVRALILDIARSIESGETVPELEAEGG